MFIGDFDNGLEVLIAALGANIAWIDSILRECSSGCWIGGQELVAVVVEITNNWHGHSLVGKPANDLRNSGCRLLVIHRDSHDLTACSSEVRNLRRGSCRIGRVRVCH